MTTALQVLTTDECAQVHAKSLEVLRRTGVRVDSERGQQALQKAGAIPAGAEDVWRLPPEIVESALELSRGDFTLGGRRPGWSLKMRSRQCSLVADGGAIYALDAVNGERRPATFDDWRMATQLTDAMDEFGCYWSAVAGTFGTRPIDVVNYWVEIFRNFSKHVQESTATLEETRWLKEILQIVFGTQEQIGKLHPVSFLICPSSPLVIEAGYTDAYLETVGLNIPVAVMPMPLLGTTGPGTLISNLVLANSEALAVVCLVQAAQPGTPIIYAPIPAISNPRTGRYGSGEVEHSLMGAAVTEMARFYDLPVETSTGGSDHHIPSIQAGYERALNFILPVLSQPDLLVSPGLLGGSLIFSPEQFIIDLEILQRCRRLATGISSAPGEWLEEIISLVGPGGNFLNQRSTRTALRSGELYLANMGFHESYEHWKEQERPDILEEARGQYQKIIERHQALPFDDDVERALRQLQKSAG
jgi:trimethylamine---corrinoid protein Co-methyltransferase